VWQGDKWEEGIGVEEEQGATLAHAGGADETKAARTQATPS